MKRLSIEEAYLWTQRFAAREWRLVLPVALAFLGLPPLLFDLLMPQTAMIALPAPGVTPDPAVLLKALPMALVVMLFGLIGSLSIMSLGLVPRISVREAITLALRRGGIVIGAVLLITAGLLLLAVLLAVLLMATGLPFITQQGLLLGLLLGVGLFIWVRLAVLWPFVLDHRTGPVTSLRTGWSLSHGHFWRLFGAILMYVIGAFVVLLAASSAIGTILVLLGRAFGVPELGQVLSSVQFRALAALASAGLQLLLVGFYRQLSSRGI